MPVISRFYGVTIRMLRARAFGARFHAMYGNSELVVRLWPWAIICGEAPRRLQQMVLEWASSHQQELLAAWPSLPWGRTPPAVEPLR